MKKRGVKVFSKSNVVLALGSCWQMHVNEGMRMDDDYDTKVSAVGSHEHLAVSRPFHSVDETPFFCWAKRIKGYLTPHFSSVHFLLSSCIKGISPPPSNVNKTLNTLGVQPTEETT
jgi:hypothetical protein